MIERYRKWFIHIAASLAFGLILLDETVVAVALPTIQKEFSMTLVLSHWVMNSYLLVLAGFIAIGGKLGDIFGFRKIFLTGLFLFGASSIAAGFAQNPTWLISSVIIQGFGAAIMFPTSVALIAHVFPANQRGIAMGIYGSIGTVFLSIGPLIGGYFTSEISWRWIFWINVPIVTIIIFIFLASWREPVLKQSSKKFDFVGLVTMVSGITLLILAIMQGPVWGWDSAIIISLFIVSALIIILFCITELKVKNPLIELDLFRSGTFNVSNLQIFTGQFCKLSVVLFGALYFQKVLHMDPLKAGLSLLPAMIPIPIMAIVCGKLTDKYGPRYPSILGLMLGGISIILIGFLTGFSRYEYILPALVLYGFSQPFLYTPPRVAVTNSVTDEKQGQASGIVSTAQMIGATMSVAVLSAVLTEFDSFMAVFILTGIFALVVTVVGWFYLDPHNKLGRIKE
jgi:EmrB/QacA subfamily drug resistance transporter